MRTSIQIGRIIGIPIRLHFTFLFILPLILVTFAEGPGPMGLGEAEELSRFLRYSVAGIAASLFFLSLLLHEMSHSYVAMKYGTKIKSITLFIFGGLALMEDLPRDPEKEWRIAIAGPLMSFALGGLFLFTYLGIRAVNVVIYEPFRILISSIGLLNLVLATFNLLPAFPMDGGRVLRALLAQRMQFLKATRRAVFVGKTFAVVLGIIGFMPDPFLLYSTGEVRILFSPWLTLIAAFLFIAATEEESATIIYAALEGTKVRAVMRAENTVVPQSIRIAELEEKMRREKNAEYAVVNESGDLKGLITFNELKKLSVEQRHSLTVSALMNPLDPMRDTISEGEEAIEALKRMLGNKKNSLAVVEEGSGRIAGIITKRDLSMHVELLKGNT
ncbi:MAG: site-2 protease family protein [Methanophagales archaeon ANME-1-THS]|nr:MAG: site-2 protease family protein [Methanophagales archaeon ANME-1-THS]